MAELIKREDLFLPKDSDFYEVVGTLTLEDIKKLNRFPRKTTLILENTKNLTSNLIDQIMSPNIFFSVRGGYDYFNKEKYKNNEYIKRTMLSPKGLTEIIKYYESIEKNIDDSLTENQKTMILYDAITKDFTYDESYESKLDSKITSRGLNGILYKKAVCAGFAIIFKEGLDRLGIKNIFQNKKHFHDWVLAIIDGKYRGLEITWECANKLKDDVCEFNYYGLDKDFYSHRGHDLKDDLWDGQTITDQNNKYILDDEEKEYDIVPFEVESLRYDYQVIKSRIERRKINNKPAFKTSEEELKLLPIDLIKYKYENSAKDEYNYDSLNSFLEIHGVIEKNKYPFFKIRNPYLLDVIGYNPSISKFNGEDVNAKILNDCTFDRDGNFNTPYGYRNTWLRETTEEITNERYLKNAFNTLKQKLDNYAKEYLMKIFKDAYFMVDELQSIRNVKVKKDHNLGLREADLYTKLKSLVDSKDLLLSYGFNEEDVNLKLDYINKYFESLVIKLTDEQIKAMDIDFYTAVFEDVDEVRKVCEEYEGKKFSDEEWKEKFQDAEYIMRIFNTADTPKETIKEILDNIYKSKYTNENKK